MYVLIIFTLLLIIIIKSTSSQQLDDPVFDISNDYYIEKEPFNLDHNKHPSIYFFAVRLTNGEYNIFVIFISIILISWLLRSIRKFFRMLRVRTSLRTGTLIFIRGIGSSLRIFDGITLNHSSSILNTRQANPPSVVQSLVMPFTIKDIKLISSKSFSLEFITSVPCVVWVVNNFNPNVYKDVYQNNTDRNDNINRKEATTFVEELVKVRRSSRSSLSVLESNSLEESKDDSRRVVVDSLGFHSLTLTLPSKSTNTITNTITSTTTTHYSHDNDNVINDVDIESNDAGVELGIRSDTDTIAVFMYPLGQIEDQIYSVPYSHANINSNNNSNSNNGNNKSNNNSQATDDTSSRFSIVNDNNFTRFDYAIQTISYDNITKTLAPTDLLIFDNNKMMYSAMEIYGGKKEKITTAATTITTNIDTDHNNTNNDQDNNSVSNPMTTSTSLPLKVKENEGNNVASEECVVCLTEALQVVLMPCRHMCVCADCLVYIDRCPICRSPFDQHLIINKDFKIIKQRNSYNTYEHNSDSYL